MKRKLFLGSIAIVALALVSPLFAQAAKSKTFLQEDFTWVFEVPEKNAKEIYENLLKYIALNFKSGKSVIEYQNPDSGEIIGNGVAEFVTWDKIYKHSVVFTVSLRVKDAKFQVMFQNLQGQASMGSRSDNYSIYDRILGNEPDYDKVRQRLEVLAIDMNKFIVASKDEDF